MQRPRRKKSDFETRGYALIGELVVHFSRLDLNLALFIAGLRTGAVRTQELDHLESVGFALRLKEVLQIATGRFQANHARLSQWQAWVAQADELRSRRNQIVHGRWDINPLMETVTNVVGLPDSSKVVETVYSLDELAQEVERALEISEGFLALRNAA